MITSDWGVTSVSDSRVHSAACRLHSWASAMINSSRTFIFPERGGEESFRLTQGQFQASADLRLDCLDIEVLPIRCLHT
jgi:hypothetical protein